MKTPKVLLTTLLSATLAFAPISVSANTIATPTPSTINFPMPDVKDVAKKIAKVGRVNAVQFAVGRLFDGIDWVMDPANNRVIVKSAQPTSACRVTWKHHRWMGTADDVAASYCQAIGHNASKHKFGEWQKRSGGVISARATCEGGYGGSAFVDCGGVQEIFVSYDQIAQEILNNALQGHLESIKFAQEVAEEKAREEGQPIAPPANPPLNPPAIPPQPISPPNTDPTTAPPQPIAGNPTQPIIFGDGIGEAERARCKKVYNMCIEECMNILPDGADRQSMNFHRCVSECREKHNCMGK